MKYINLKSPIVFKSSNTLKFQSLENTQSLLSLGPCRVKIKSQTYAKMEETGHSYSHFKGRSKFNGVNLRDGCLGLTHDLLCSKGFVKFHFFGSANYHIQSSSQRLRGSTP